MQVIDTRRLTLRELDSAIDAEFIFELLNSPKFIRYIGDRGVRSPAEAAAFIEEHYQPSYRKHGFGLYAVESRQDEKAVGMCGFVRRKWLAGPDLGFAFLPQFERLGFGHESAAGILKHGMEVLGVRSVLAVTTLDNQESVRLLEKLGFKFRSLVDSPDNEKLRLYFNDLGSLGGV